MLKVMFYSVGIFRTSGPGGSISSNSENYSEEVEKKSGYIEVC